MTRQHAALVATAAAVTAGLVVVVSSIAFSADDPKSSTRPAFVDPAASLPPAEREAVYMRQLGAHTTARHNWIAAFEAQGRSVADLQRVELSVEAEEPKATLATAVAAADVIVRGVVVDLTFTPAGTVASVRVDEVLKGIAGGTISINVGGGPEPDRAFGRGVLAVDPAMPFLFENTHALLFLRAEPAGTALPAGYSVQSVSGTYLVDEGEHVHAHEGNPFAATTDNMPVAAFTDLVRRAST